MHIDLFKPLICIWNYVGIITTKYSLAQNEDAFRAVFEGSVMFIVLYVLSTLFWIINLRYLRQVEQ